jgi:hypothetical protein
MTVPEVNNFDIGPNVVGTNVTWDIVVGIINANVGIAVVVVTITASTGDGEGGSITHISPPPPGRQSKTRLSGAGLVMLMRLD